MANKSRKKRTVSYKITTIISAASVVGPKEDKDL